MDVGHNTAVGDGDVAEQLGELLIVLDGELDVAGDDAALLVVAGSVAWTGDAALVRMRERCSW